MNPWSIISCFLIAILLLWNIVLFIRNNNKNNESEHYFELNAKLNFIAASGTLLILVVTFLGWNVRKEILMNSNVAIKEMVQVKSHEVDSLLESKNILKAGIYIVNDIDFKENKVYKFEDLLTIDNKSLPRFSHPPKLIINTNTGENLRIKEITDSYFILSKPIAKYYFISDERTNPEYPKIIKFDVWIGDYKSK